jgi:predicted nucleotidyltransferase
VFVKRRLGYSEYKPVIDRFVALVEDALQDNLVSAVLYGSVARGEARPESDVDLLLILEQASPVYWERLQLLMPILRQLRRLPCWKDLEAERIFPELNLIILSRPEAEQNRYLYLDMIEDSRVLLDREDFFHRRLQTLKARLLELGARKVKQDGNWYWDLKPDLKPGEVVIL